MTTIDPDFEAAAEAYFKEVITDDETTPDSVEVPEPDEPTEVPGEEDQPESPAEEVPDDDQVVQAEDPFEGLSKEQISAYKKFDELLKTRPDLEYVIAQNLGLVPPSAPVTQPQPVAQDGPTAQRPAPPPLDLDDPSQRWLYERYMEQEQRLAQVTNAVIANNRQTATQQEQANTAILNRAFASFKQQHNIDDVEMNQVVNLAGRLNVLPSLLNPIDPMTGVPRKVDPLSAVEQALDIAYWQIPGLREKEVATIAANKKAAQARKQKAGALSGNSGSAPRRPAPVPTDEIGRRRAMVETVAQMMSGTYSEE